MGKNKVLFSFDPPQIKERGFWPKNPATQVIKSKKYKGRNKLNREAEMQLKEVLSAI